MAGDEVVVSLSHAEGTAGVLRDADGTLWLTGFVEEGPGTMIDDFRGSIEGAGDALTVMAGLLPEGAAAVELLPASGERFPAAVGDGAWLAVVEEDLYEPLAAHFLDAQGKTVRTPLPPEWPREVVGDAVEPCPICGATGWEMVTPLDHSRGSTGSTLEQLRPAPVVVCVSCGYEIGCGGWVTAEMADISDQERAELEARHQQARRKEQREVLAQVSIPVLVLADWDGPVGLAGFGRSGERITSVSVSHGDESSSPWARVDHDTQGGDWYSCEGAVRERAEPFLHDRGEFPAERSRGAWSVWLDHHERAAALAASRLTVEQVTVRVDERDHQAVLCRHDDVIACAADIGRGRLTVVARGVPAERLSFRTLADPIVLADAG